MVKRLKSKGMDSDATQDPRIISLPQPKLDRGGSLFKALRQRRTVRDLSDRSLSSQLISDLLWAAWGVNRKKGPFGISGRTAASASNSQEIQLYVALQNGVFLYQAPAHRLVPVAGGDLRALAIGPGQPTAGSKAPLHLIYVADIDKLANSAGFKEPGLQDPEIQKSYYYVDTGLIAGNVYLFAASQGLAAWFHNCKKNDLAKVLRLRSDQRVLFAQTLGYPGK
jgi:hypothetical protein